MLIDIRSMKTEELLNLYNKMNAEVNKQLISGTSWYLIKDEVDYLTELSKELTKRKINLDGPYTTPADTPYRNED